MATIAALYLTNFRSKKIKLTVICQIAEKSFKVVKTHSLEVINLSKSPKD
jgi:hypothetical protein